jgi:uncharacterized integral membrane protein
VILLLIFSVLLCIVAALFALENTAAVTVTFLSYKFDGSLAVVLMIVFGLGLMVAVTALLPALLTSKWQVISLRRRLKQAGVSSPPEERPGEQFQPPAPPPEEPPSA